MHFGYNNHKYQYSLSTEMLNVSCREKLLGVLTNDKLTFIEIMYIVCKES